MPKPKRPSTKTKLTEKHASYVLRLNHATHWEELCLNHFLHSASIISLARCRQVCFLLGGNLYPTANICYATEKICDRSKHLWPPLNICSFLPSHSSQSIWYIRKIRTVSDPWWNHATIANKLTLAVDSGSKLIMSLRSVNFNMGPCHDWLLIEAINSLRTLLCPCRNQWLWASVVLRLWTTSLLAFFHLFFQGKPHQSKWQNTFPLLKVSLQ